MKTKTVLGHCYDLAMPLREGAESQSDRCGAGISRM